jgi:hypothetical protein
MTNPHPFARLNHFASDSEIESHSISGLVLGFCPEVKPHWRDIGHADVEGVIRQTVIDCEGDR